MDNLFSERLKASLKKINMSPAELSRRTKIPISAISQYMSGNFRPRQTRTFIIAQALGVDAGWLMGFSSSQEPTTNTQVPQFDNIYPINLKKVPMLGEIACGEPIWANEEYGEYVDVDEDLDVDFCLRAKGDSMRDACILDGDIVYIKKMPMVDNGDIAAVVIDNEATLKRVYYKREENELTLVAANPSYEPMTFRGEQLDHIHILGKAIVFMSKVRHRA